MFTVYLNGCRSTQLCYCFSTGCPSNVTITSSTGGQIISGQTVFNCSSVGGFPVTTYKWYSGSALLQNGSQYTVPTPGPFLLTCVATSTGGDDSCAHNQTVNYTAIGRPFIILSAENGLFLNVRTLLASSDSLIIKSDVKWSEDFRLITNVIYKNWLVIW